MADYDVIVVGAGPGGTAAAKVAAEKKLKVLLLERGRTPGDKNMSGSYLFRNICEELFPVSKKPIPIRDRVELVGSIFAGHMTTTRNDTAWLQQWVAMHCGT